MPITSVTWPPHARCAAALAVLAAVACERAEPPPTRELITTRTLGLAYLEEYRLDEAAAEFHKLIRIAPDEPLGYANLGLVYLRQARYTEAEEQIRRAVERAPDDADIRLLLATVYDETGRPDEARRVLEQTVERSPDHVKSLYVLTALYAALDDPEARRRREQHLVRLVERAPANIVARLELVEASLVNDKPDQAARRMEEIRRQVPVFSDDARRAFDRALDLMRAGQSDSALAALSRFESLVTLTSAYQAGLQDLRGPGGALAGYPILTLRQDLALETRDPEAVLAALRFTDITELAGLDVVRGGPEPADPTREPGTRFALGDFDGDGDQDLYVAHHTAGMTEAVAYLLRNDLGQFVDEAAQAGLTSRGAVTAARFGDYDNDGALDLFVAGPDGATLWRNRGDGRFENATATARVAGAAGAYAALFVDLDHDGDLDLVTVRDGPNRVFRNNLDGTFTEVAAPMGLAGSRRSHDVAFGDFDDDADMDLVVADDEGVKLYANLRGGRFEDVTARAGLAGEGGARAVAVGDYDNDGYLDLLVVGATAGEYTLYRNRQDATFERDRRSRELFAALRGVTGLDAEFFDFDNDGFLDLVIAGRGAEGAGRGLFLFRNDGRGVFRDATRHLPDDIGAARQVAVFDYGEDGDLDLLVATLDGRVRLLRNDGGNANYYVRLELVGLTTGSSKNNRFGIGSKVELRVGDVYQMRVVREPVTHFGLGQRLKADVLRITWTNGVPQNFYYPGTDQDLVEEQTLKGSCAFLYTWDGARYVFVTDVMWKSAIGMPVGIMAGGGQAYAPSHASQEYLRIPGELLTPRDGAYRLKLTEELWEVAYADEVTLLAVDHPESVEVYVDEKFVPPGPPELRLYRVGEKRLPLAASDERGTDLLPPLRAKDDVYVANLVPGRHQGIVAPHALVLDFGTLPQADSVWLFIQGWIFPTDASINVAVSQNPAIELMAPYLEVRDRQGRWRRVAEVGFPSGKDKTVVVDLTGRFLSDDHRVRIRTNMEIYWDHAFVGLAATEAPLRITTLRPVRAELRYRGFSREYRKGGRYGPHWFDHDVVSAEPRWLPITGRYTRYGDVLPLVLASDDRYVVMAPGDELSLEFAAAETPTLPPGWRRDFLIYTDGWIKDADLNTATGNTVAPLPFHAMSRYPYGPDERFPAGREHRRFVRQYLTRVVTASERSPPSLPAPPASRSPVHPATAPIPR